MMKTITAIMITTTCMHDNRSEYDDTPFLYDDTPQEMNSNQNLYYNNRDWHNDNSNRSNNLQQQILKAPLVPNIQYNEQEHSR